MDPLSTGLTWVPLARCIYRPMSLGSHGEYAQEQLTIYASGAPTFSEAGGWGAERREEAAERWKEWFGWKQSRPVLNG